MEAVPQPVAPRMAASASTPMNAVAASASARVPLVHQVESNLPTAPAQGPALLVSVVVLAACALRTSVELPTAGLLQGAALCVVTIANVLPGSFVPVGFVLQRARGSASQVLGAISSQIVPR